MERDFEKDMMELDAAIKSNAERDNTFTLSVLQRAKVTIVQQKENMKAYEDTGLTPEEIAELKRKRIPMQIKKVHCDEYYCPACGAENTCNDMIVEDIYCPECGQKLYQ